VDYFKWQISNRNGNYFIINKATRHFVDDRGNVTAIVSGSSILDDGVYWKIEKVEGESFYRIMSNYTGRYLNIENQDKSYVYLNSDAPSYWWSSHWYLDPAN
jgi:hypothetical protein